MYFILFCGSSNRLDDSDSDVKESVYRHEMEYLIK